MRTRNLMVGLIGVGIVAVVVWVVMVAVPRLSGELTGELAGDGRLPALPVVVASDMQWESGPGTVGSWVTTAAVFGSDGFIYALSTAPGLRNIPEGVPIPHAVYRSQDGFAWEVEPLTGLGEDLYARDLAHSGSNLYVVGTAPSAANPAAAVVRVGSSQDGGTSWESVDLELANDPDGRVAGGMHVDVTANPSGVLVSASRSIFGANQVAKTDLTVFAGTGLDDLKAVTVPFGEGDSVERLEATPDMFYAFVRPSGGFEARFVLLELWRSVDGKEWEQLENFAFLDSVSSFGEVGGRRVVVGQLEGRVVLGASIDDMTWDEMDMSEMLPPAGGGNQWVSASSVGAAGLYFHVQSFLPAGPDSMHEVSQLIESPDLLSWSSTATVNLLQGYVEQIVVGDDFVFVNGISGVPGTRVHLMGTLG